MNKLRIPTLFLATALQVMPMLRNIVPVSAQGFVPSVWAIILQWGVGAAALGAYDAVSAPTVVVFTMPTNFTCTVGVPVNFFLTITNYKTDPGAYFTNNSALPAGLSITTFDNTSLPDIHGNIVGTPTQATNNMKVKVSANYNDGTTLFTAPTNIFITVQNAVGMAPVITNQPVSLTNNVGSIANFTVTAGGTAPLAYQWRKNITNNLSGATNVTYTITNCQTNDAGSFTVVITNAIGSVTSSPPAVLTVSSATPPGIAVSPPAALSITAGQPAGFAVIATGTDPLAYQWVNGATPIAGATTNNYTIANAHLADAGNYAVIVTNAAGSITSSVSVLTVNLPATPMAQVARAGTEFYITFTTVVGLTNSVLTNAGLAAPNWNVFTNIPPPVSASSVTVTDTVVPEGRLYRVQIIP